MFSQQVQRITNQQIFWKNIILEQIKINMYIVQSEIQTMKCAYQTHLADWNGYPHLRNKSASNEQAAAMCYTSIPFELLPLFLPLLQIAISNPFFSRNQDHLAHKGKFVNLSYMYIILVCSTSFVVESVQKKVHSHYRVHVLNVKQINFLSGQKEEPDEFAQSCR